MIKTEVTRVLGLPGFAPADEPAYANRQEQYGCTNRKASMKRIVDALGKVNWEKRAHAVIVLCATAIVLPAKTFTTLHNFDGMDGSSATRCQQRAWPAMARVCVCHRGDSTGACLLYTSRCV